ncbi:ecdysteroid kinase domain-containing protein [Phthorimaea operculella]|nr:ecdysteroid kinase domain-containing protein [Phthorimaea operculella]
MNIPQNLQIPLDNIIKKEGYLSYKAEIDEVGAKGISFISKTYTVNIKGKTENGDKDVKLFVKISISVEMMKDVCDMPHAYAAEAFFHNELSQIFEELQDDAGIAPPDRLRIIKSYGECNFEVTILENVAVKGYKTCHRTYTMDLEVAETALKELAKFHALSFVVKAKKPEYYANKIKGLKHPFVFNKEFDRSVLNVAQTALEHIKEGTRENLVKFLENYGSKWRNYQQDLTSTVCCLCHGDFRLNNILLKYAGDKLEDLYIIDYQLMNFGSPIYDFLFFIFTGTDQQFRRQHLDHLRHFYYESFSEFLKKFNLNSEDIYPKREFEKDYRERLDYGLIVALFFMSFILADDKTIPDLDKESMADMDIKVLKDYPIRMQGLVDDYIEWGYL